MAEPTRIDNFEGLSAKVLEVEKNNFINNVERLIRRSIIYRSENRSAVRERESQIDVKKTARNLLESETLLTEESKGNSKTLFEYLSPRYDGIRAIVVFNSGVHGGAILRSVLETPKKSDMDWGVIYDPQLFDVTDDTFLHQVNNDAVEFMREKGVVLCHDLNVKKLHTPILSENDTQKIDETLKKFEAKSGYHNDSAILNILPSYPEEVGGKNREILFNRLSEISVTDEKKWKDIVKSILKTWRQNHSIKQKHMFWLPLNSARGLNTKDWKLIHKIADISSDLMSQPFKKVLLSTNKSSTKPSQ